MFWNKLFSKKEEKTPQWIIAGLGNPGVAYAITRHNAGFMCLDRLAEKYGIQVCESRFDSVCGYGVIEGQDCILVKPQTYMNKSGIAVEKILNKYNLPPERMIIISDDVSFDVGRMRIRRSGSSGGQNGLNSIIDTIGTQGFPRIKIGVGKKPQGLDMADWVLSNFSADELEELKPILDNACSAASMIINGETDIAMQKFN